MPDVITYIVAESNADQINNRINWLSVLSFNRKKIKNAKNKFLTTGTIIELVLAATAALSW